MRKAQNQPYRFLLLWLIGLQVDPMEMRMQWQHAGSRTIDDRSNRGENAGRTAIVTAAIYLCAAVSLVGYFRYHFYWNWGSLADNAYEIGALFGLILLLGASIDLFTWRRFGDAIALAGVALVWPQLRLAEFNRYAFSDWLTFNIPGSSPDLTREFVIASLSILSVTSIIFATVFSLLRLIPPGCAISVASLRKRAWPGVLISSCCTTSWYVVAVTPYRTPIISDGPRAELFLWHVQRNGLQFHETSIAFFRDGRFYLVHNDRRLFEYRFPARLADGVLPVDSLQLFRGMENASPSFPPSNSSARLLTRIWNADYWFVADLNRHTGKQVKAVIPALPIDMLMLFDETMSLPYERKNEEILRDVCFGFCYGPQL